MLSLSGVVLGTVPGRDGGKVEEVLSKLAHRAKVLTVRCGDVDQLRVKGNSANFNTTKGENDVMLSHFLYSPVYNGPTTVREIVSKNGAEGRT